MPNTDPSTSLHSVFTFYSDILTLTSEGDSIVSDETLEGLGRTSDSLLQTLFGSILRLASSPDKSQNPWFPPDPSTNSLGSSPVDSQGQESSPRQTSPASDDNAEMDAVARKPIVQTANDAVVSTADTDTIPRVFKPPGLPATRSAKIEPGMREKGKKFVLINYLPDPGYFIAGAVAGGISRTTTAPLDRLKVYLLVNTRASANPATEAARKGQPLLAVKNAGRPLVAAVTDLYKSGGLRGFFAGMPPSLLKTKYGPSHSPY